MKQQQYQYMQGSKNSCPGGWIQGVSADIFYISLIFHGSRGGPSIPPVVRMVSNFLQRGGGGGGGGGIQVLNYSLSKPI